MSQGGVFGLPLLFDILDPSHASKNSSFLLRLRHLSIGNPCISRQYAPSRSGDVAEELVGDFQGYLQTDGYLGYTALGERETICPVGCLAHIRGAEYSPILRTVACDLTIT